MASTFRTALEFFAKLGVYDVLLPFILVFSIMFAILEKTKVLGIEKHGDQEGTRKNMNSLVAFVIAFFVVASSRLVATINQALAHIVILLLLAVFFLVLIGVFHEEGKPIFLEKGPWRTGGMIFMLIGIILIFLNAIKTKTGVSWLEWAWDYMVQHWNGAVVGSIIFLIIIIAGIIWITRSPSESSKSSESNGGD
ncbi:MAG: hypothetical protein ACOCWQ_00780 [Nanoarchaeota archaeon]